MSLYDDSDRYDDDYDPELECEHESYEIDVCSGRAYCDCCSASWWLSAEEVDAELNRQSTYQQDCERCERWERQERRREFWRKITLPIRWSLFRLLSLIWKRKALSTLTDAAEVLFARVAEMHARSPKEYEWDTLWSWHNDQQYQAAEKEEYDRAKEHKERAASIRPFTSFGKKDART